jgi:hypothetical protein
MVAWNGSDFVITGITTVNLATDVSGTLPIANGGTGQTTQQAAINALVGTQTANRVLRSDGTNSTLSQVALTTDVTGTLPIGSGGTGQTTANAAFNALAPSQASANGKYLKSDGTNASWDAIDISTADITGTLPVGNGGTGATTLTGLLLGNGTSAVTTVTAPSGAVVGTTDTQTLTNKTISGSSNTLTNISLTSSVTGTLPTTNGGTGLTSFTANGVVYASSSSALTTGSALTFDGASMGIGVTPSARLDVSGASGGIFYVRGTGDAYQEIAGGGRTPGTGSLLVGQGNAGEGYLWNRFNNYIAFGVNNAEQMRLTSTGLGIGTSSPGTKLDVSGQGRVTESGTGSGDGGFISNTGSANGNAGLLFQTNSTSRWNLTTQGTNGANLRIYNYTLGSTVATFDSSGNLVIGDTSASYRLDVKGGTGNGIAYRDGTVSNYLGTTGSNLGYLGTLTNHPVAFLTNATERARIDSSGNLLVGTTSNGGAGGFSIAPNNSAGAPTVLWDRTTTTSTSTAAQFRNGGTAVGEITYTNTATAYVTSSDYRLKEDIQPMTGALAKVAAFNPVTYKWKVDSSDGEGFIAHELAEVVPQCVTGQKDAVDAEGKPVYQGIDTSFLVATLTAAIQEQQALIESLTARVAQLEGK